MKAWIQVLCVGKSQGYICFLFLYLSKIQQNHKIFRISPIIPVFWSLQADMKSLTWYLILESVLGSKAKEKKKRIPIFPFPISSTNPEIEGQFWFYFYNILFSMHLCLKRTKIWFYLTNNFEET
jgi:hypothetical protein